MDRVSIAAAELQFCVEMYKPESIKIEPWTSFPRQAYSIHTDDFVHDTIFTTKVEASSERAFFSYKSKVHEVAKTISRYEETKFWFHLSQGRSISGRVKNNSAKFTYDHGILTYGKWNWNFYQSVNCNHSVENLSIRFGANVFSKTISCDTRLKINTKKKGSTLGNGLVLYNRIFLEHKNMKLGLIGVYDIAERILAKNSLLLGYKINDSSSIYLHAENDKFRLASFKLTDYQNYFDTLRLNYLYDYDSETKLGLEALFKTKSSVDVIEAVVEKKFSSNKYMAKVKFNTLGDLSALLRFPTPRLQCSTTSIGMHGKSIQDKNRTSKYGLELAFNI